MYLTKKSTTEQICSSAAALPLAKCYGIFNDRWWSELCFYHHQWSPLATCAGLAGLMSTEHAYLNQHFDVPSSKYPILNHLGKPSHSQVLKKWSYPIYRWWTSWPCDPWQQCDLSVWWGNCPGWDCTGLVPAGTEPRWCWDPNNIWIYLSNSQILPWMHHDLAGSTQGKKKMKQTQQPQKQKEASRTDLSVLAGLLWGSELCWNASCRWGGSWGFSPVQVLWFVFMLHPFYLLGHSLYQTWQFPRNL